MRRKPGSLVPLELAICATAARLFRVGVAEFYGYQLAKHMANEAGRRPVVAYGTLYRALGRLQQMGLLESRWEEPEEPAREGRPSRRLYTLTSAGAAWARVSSSEKPAGTSLVSRKPVPA